MYSGTHYIVETWTLFVKVQRSWLRIHSKFASPNPSAMNSAAGCSPGWCSKWSNMQRIARRDFGAWCHSASDRARLSHH